MQSAR